jgi:hypothetical protein
MNGLDLVQLAAQAGGPTVVACLALWIIYKLILAMVPDMMSRWEKTTEAVLECQKDNTEAVTRLRGTIDAQGDVMKEVRTLLVSINGRKE